MKSLHLLVAASLLLGGCSVRLPAPSSQFASPFVSAQGAKKTADAPFFQVQAGEVLGRQEVGVAAGKFCYDNVVNLPLGPDDEIERVTQVSLNEAAGRLTKGGNKEFVGLMTFYGKRVGNSFIVHHKRLPFRMTLAANKRLVSFDVTDVDLGGVTILKPDFQTLSAEESQKIKTDVLAFIEPMAEPKPGVFSALFGRNDQFTAEIVRIRATAGKFGEFGRVIELTIPLRYKSGGLLYTYTYVALLDRRGKVISVSFSP